MASVAIIKTAIPSQLDQTLRLAERSSLTLAQLRQRLRATEGELAFREAEFKPTLRFDVNASIAQVSNINTLDISSGLNLMVPLYDGGLNDARLRNAQLAVETVQQELISARERLAIDIRSEWNLLSGLTLALKYFEAAISDLGKLVELTKNKLDAGRATFIEYIEAQQSVLSARFDALDNRLRLAATRIKLVSMLAGLKS